MKRLLLFVAAATLLSPGLSLAQRPDQGNRPDRPDHHGGPGPNKPGGPVTLPAKPPERPNQGGPNRPGRPDTGRPGMGPPPRPNPPSMRPPPRPGRPQFSWRGRYFNPIHGPSFRYPHGYSYRRWSIGAFLPGLFLSSSYYYDNWRMLGIDPPPPGRRWVRYGPDLLLVNLRTRRVEDVITNVFY